MNAYQQQPPLTGVHCDPASGPSQPYQATQPRRVGCCLLSTLIKVIVAILVLLGITALILWLVLRPWGLNVSVDSASLTQFNLNPSTSNLQYNMSADISIRNPNSNAGVYFDWLEANAFYVGERFSFVPLPAFYQGHKNTTIVHPKFTGQSVVALGYSGVNYYSSQNQTGAFDIDVWLVGWIRYRVGIFTTWTRYWRAQCSLVVPLAANDTSRSGTVFRWTPCYVYY